jgi:NitT/TauT family transport system permease protein
VSVAVDPAMTASDVPGTGSTGSSAGRSPRRRRLRRPSRRTVLVRVLQLALIVTILCVWQFGSGNPSRQHVLFDDFFVSKPTAIWHVLERWYRERILARNIWITLQEALIGFAIGCTSGVIVGLGLGMSRLTSDVFRPLITAAYSVPRLALAPMFILWFGLGMQSKIALVALMVFFLTFFNAFAGAREVDQELVNVLRIMGAPGRKVHTKVTIPSAAVWLIAGFRISIPYAFVGAIVGEIIASNRGIGYLIARATDQFDSASLFAAIFLAVALSVAMTAIVTILERRVLRWKTTPQ